jgi:hypothetical protein
MIDLGTIFLFLALLVPVGLYIARPLMERRSLAVSDEEQALSALMAERDRLLDAVQELEMDKVMGKIPEDVFPAQREDLIRRGAEVLRKIDKFYEKYQVEDPDLQLEAAIAARRTESDTSTDPEPILEPEPVLERIAAGSYEDDRLEDLIAARRQAHAGKATGFCPQCGTAIQKNDRFCSNCGTIVGLTPS